MASTVVVLKERSKREVCVLGTPSSCVCVCVCVCTCVCVHQDRPSGSSKTVENASIAAVELWLSALSPGWQLLVALLSQFSHNHPV